MCAFGRAASSARDPTSQLAIHPISHNQQNRQPTAKKVCICIYITDDEVWSVTPGAQVALREVAQLQDVRLSSVGH
jgi:hypothetical protein